MCLSDNKYPYWRNGVSRIIFGSKLIRGILFKYHNENIVYSPASIQTCLALIFFGASGVTAEILRAGLSLEKSDERSVRQRFADFLLVTMLLKNPQPKIINRIYLNNDYADKIKSNFVHIARKYFKTKIKLVNFNISNDRAAKKINKSISKQTNKTIRNIVNGDILNKNMNAVLVNGIYFRAKWRSPFDLSLTSTQDFTLSSGERVPVEMMRVHNYFKYSAIPDLDATVVELPYGNSNISMMIILPNKIDGLAHLEQQLFTTTFTEICWQLNVENLTVHLPKFRVELEIDLRNALTELGMADIFSNTADFTNFLSSHENQSASPISLIRHKAYLEVDEIGSLAKCKKVPKVEVPLVPSTISFTVNHPFMFAIRNFDDIYFTGHVVKI